MTRQRPQQGGRSRNNTGISSLSLFWFRFRLNQIRDRLCHLVCGDRLFNSDMSRELDRKQARIDELEERRP